MPPSKRNLNNLESLLLAQAVWELGADTDTWQPISRLLSKHPLVSRPKSFFTPQSCHSMYESLMKDAGLEIDESTESPNAQTNLLLAQKHYRARFSQLKDLILAEETKFKTILKEIEDIRSGNWGKEAKSSETKQSTEGVEESNPIPEVPGAEQLAPEPDVTKPVNETKPQTVSEEAQPGIHDGPTDGKEEVISTRKALAFRTSSSPPPSMDVDKEVAPAPSAGDTDNNEPNPECDTPQSDRREEEEEEETVRDEEGKQEEEEMSQGNHDDMEIDQNEDHTSKSPAETSDAVEEHDERDSSESPPPPETDLPAEEEEEDDKADEVSAEEEPVVTTRRSTRHRKSSAASAVPPPPPLPRTRQRRGRPSDNEPQPAPDSEAEGEAKDGSTSQAEDDLETISARRREGKRKASTNELLESPDKKRMREDSEALDDEDQGSTSHNTRGRVTRGATRTEEQVALKRFQNVIAMLHQQISQHRNGNIFHNPIKNSEAPDYHDIVKRPMDLKTIKTRVKDGVIANSLEYQRDIYLMFANAMMYNRPGSDVHTMAEDMMVESEAQIHTFRQTEGLAKRQRL